VPPLAYFGIESHTFSVVVDLLIVVAVVLYLALAFWTYADARRRVLDPMLVGCATAAALLFPFVGALVYVIVRPPEFLEDVQERELEMQAAQARLEDLGHGRCPHCEHPIERDFVRCPSCLRKLKERCVACERPLDRAWAICPYCEAEVAGVAPRRRSRRRSAVADSPEGELTVAALEDGRTAGAAPKPASSRSEDPLRGASRAEVPPRGTARAEVPPRGTARAEVPPRGASRAEVPPRGTSRAEVPPRGAGRAAVPPAGRSRPAAGPTEELI